MMKNLFLDFDGVLVDSNHLKSSALREVSTLLFGETAGEEMVKYHLANPGFSRFDLFRHIWSEFGITTEWGVPKALAYFSHTVMSGYIGCSRVSDSTVENLSQYSPVVLTAAPRDEILELLELFGWGHYFNSRVLGSPGRKSELLLEYLEGAPLEEGSLFAGDAESDFRVAMEFGIGFVFVSGWSDWKPSKEDRREFAGTVDSIAELPELLSLRI